MNVENIIVVITAVIMLFVFVVAAFWLDCIACKRRKAYQLELERKRLEYMRFILEELHANDWRYYDELLDRLITSTDDKKKG